MFSPLMRGVDRSVAAKRVRRHESANFELGTRRQDFISRNPFPATEDAGPLETRTLTSPSVMAEHGPSGCPGACRWDRRL
jgi:hypothetical protein